MEQMDCKFEDRSIGMDNFKRFLKELTALCDKYHVTDIRACNGNVEFESNDDIASFDTLSYTHTRGELDYEWLVIRAQVANKPIYVYLNDEEEK